MGVGSGDAARERFPSDEADAAPPCMRNGRQDRLWVGGGVGFGAGAGGGMGRGGVLCRERESRCRPDACEGVGEVSPGECRRDLWPDLRWLLWRLSREGDRLRDGARDAAGVVSLPDEPERLDETATFSRVGEASRRG